MITITAQDFGKYLAIQRSGVTNMFDITTVQKLTKLPREKILKIMNHYRKYQQEFGEGGEE